MTALMAGSQRWFIADADNEKGQRNIRIVNLFDLSELLIQ
jgi:hypothetical protein